MVKVCQDWFPMGSYNGQRDSGIFMDPTLKANLDIWIKNVVKDWDFVLIISGQGMVRVGKSLLAQQIACYWCYEIERLYGVKVPFTIKDNMVFDGGKLIKQGNRIGQSQQYGCLVFDEAGADLEGIKVMKRTTQAVKDYLRECGQYNMLTILVLPEFFDLPKGIALSRSDALIDVYTLTDENDYWERGFYNFYGRPAKKKLYLYGKKELNYHASKFDFHGQWDGVWVVDEEEYRAAKRVALKKREIMSAKEQRMKDYLVGSLKILLTFDLSYREIAHRIGKIMKFAASHSYIGRLLGGEKLEDDEDD